MDEKRKAESARGGRRRWAEADPAEAAATRLRAAAAANSPVARARQIAKAWPAMTEEERAEVRSILWRPLHGKRESAT